MNRFFLSHFLINVYLLALLQPMYPVLDYLVNYDYIAEQLCENRDKPVLACNGKCYLGEQLKDSREKLGDRERPLPPATEFEKLTTTGPCDFTYHLSEPEEFNPRPMYWLVALPTVFSDRLLRPPIT